MRRSLSYTLLGSAAAVTLALAVAACGDRVESAPPPAAPVVQLAPENVVAARAGALSSGPTISGQLTPARKASVRAQVGGSIVLLPFDRGQSVGAGAVIAKISSRDLEMSFESANAAVKSAETSLAVATSEAQRTEALVKGGALAARDLEQAKNSVANAEANLAATRSRQRSTWQQLDDTTIKAPFDGVVADRPASLGDVVSPGTELLTIIDPSSLRLEALVASDQIEDVRMGTKAHFSIRGATGEFTGAVERVSPAADPVTRQVSVFIAVPNPRGKLIAGLFADGRLDTATHKGIVVPLSAVDETGPAPAVTRIRDGKAERVTVVLGPRRTDTEEVEVSSGVADGDVLIVGSAKGVAAGTPVKVIK